MKETIPLSLLGAEEEPSPFPKVLLHKIQHRLENEKHVNKGQDPGKPDNIKLNSPPTYIGMSATRKACKVLVIGDSLLRGTEATIYCPDNFSREICCLPGACISDVTDRLSSLVNPTDYYLLVLFHVGYNDTLMRQLRSIKKDYMSLEPMLKRSGPKVVFSSISSVRGKGSRRQRQIERIMTICMAGAIFKALSSVVMDLTLRSWVCWDLMGFT